MAASRASPEQASPHAYAVVRLFKVVATPASRTTLIPRLIPGRSRERSEVLGRLLGFVVVVDPGAHAKTSKGLILRALGPARARHGIRLQEPRAGDESELCTPVATGAQFIERERRCAVTIKRSFFGCALGVMVVMLLAGPAVAGRDNENGRHGVDQLPGSWNVQIMPAGTTVTLPALFTFTSDGAMVTSESPGPFESSGHGSWVGRGREAAFTFFALVGSPAGQNTARIKVVGTLEAHDGGWTGEFALQVFDAAGHLLATTGGALQLTRIVVEPLPAD
jgi:hypothetical protein